PEADHVPVRRRCPGEERRRQTEPGAGLRAARLRSAAHRPPARAGGHAVDSPGSRPGNGDELWLQGRETLIWVSDSSRPGPRVARSEHGWKGVPGPPAPCEDSGVPGRPTPFEDSGRATRATGSFARASSARIMSTMMLDEAPRARKP